ncbi:MULTISPECIES: TetR/AcrR family transcriptional regulator [Cupriavidus]|uniref:TetR/AcrR family transcriptional regulator n=1 Tax=Cupriavidus TaxID=106589 RepID=UPI000A55B74E|nr:MULTISPECIES: TetR/AcrR family transcriptional regulator [Cupriavidus]
MPLPAKAPSRTRRKPIQARSWQTSLAIQEAFVRLLVQTGDYDGITIRAIIDLAGVGLGTFYEYFANKEELVRVCLHLRTKAILQAMGQALDDCAGRRLRDVTERLIDVNIDHHRPTPERWGPLYLLERHYSGQAAYQKTYDRFIDAWRRAFLLARDWPAGVDAQEAAATAQTLVYGLIARACISAGARVDHERLRRQVRLALHGYLRECRRTAPA